MIKRTMYLLFKNTIVIERKNTPPSGYLGVYGAVRRQFQKFPITMTSCSSGKKIGLKQSSSAHGLTTRVGICHT